MRQENSREFRCHDRESHLQELSIGRHVHAVQDDIMTAIMAIAARI